MKIFAINPGSTGMKAALYEDLEMLWSDSVSYSEEEIERCKGMPEKEELFRFSNSLEILEKHGNRVFRTLSRGRQGRVLRAHLRRVW
jgi:butyrate kinase